MNLLQTPFSLTKYDKNDTGFRKNTCRVGVENLTAEHLKAILMEADIDTRCSRRDKRIDVLQLHSLILGSILIDVPAFKDTFCIA